MVQKTAITDVIKTFADVESRLRNRLYDVLRILKLLGQVITEG